MSAFTYGTVPAYVPFFQAFTRNVEGRTYPISLDMRTEDYARIAAVLAANNAAAPTGTRTQGNVLELEFSPGELYALLQVLADLHWADTAHPVSVWANRWSVGIMRSLGFDW